MSELVMGAGAAAGAGAIWWVWRGTRLRRISRERLNDTTTVDTSGDYVIELQPTLRRHPLIAWMIGAGIGLVGFFVLHLALIYCVAAAVITGVLAQLVEQQIAARRALRLETQLANSIDLMVAALGAGSGVAESIESASRESREPLRSELQEVLGRIRYGEDPKTVFEDFSTRIPLETYRIFCFTMAVHGEVGGSLAPTLATIGKTIRDRIEISRRIRAQATEAQASVVGIVCITYFLGLMMWRTNPGNFEEFLRHPIGGYLVGGAMMMQALGLLWITKLAQLKF